MGVEGAFRVLVPGDAVNAQISGRVDRLEKTEDGRYVIVDLKTGKTKPNKNQIAEHAQLAAYQVAVEAGAGDAMSRDFDVEPDGLDMSAGLEHREAAPQRFEAFTRKSGGAALVQLGDGTAATSRNRPQEQDALDPDTGIWAVQLVQRAAELIAGAVMQTRHRPGETCRLPEICPLCPQGRQITQD